MIFQDLAYVQTYDAAEHGSHGCKFMDEPVVCAASSNACSFRILSLDMYFHSQASEKCIMSAGLVKISNLLPRDYTYRSIIEKIDMVLDVQWVQEHFKIQISGDLVIAGAIEIRLHYVDHGLVRSNM